MFEALSRLVNKIKHPPAGMDHVESVYFRLRPYERAYGAAGANLEYRRIAPPELVKNLYALSNDIETTAHLVRVLHQRIHGQKFVESISIDEFVASDPENAVREAVEMSRAAEAFCDESMSLSKNGQISNAPRVHEFLSENLTAIVDIWAHFVSDVAAQSGK